MEMICFDRQLRILCVNDEVFLHNPAKLVSYNLKSLVNKPLLDVIAYLAKPQSIANAIDYISTINQNINDKNFAEKTIFHLISRGFLRKYNPDSAEELWYKNGWSEAWSFHTHTNNLPKIQYNTKKLDKEDVGFMEEYVAVENTPSNYKFYEDDQVPLEKPAIDQKYKIVPGHSKTAEPHNLNFQLLSRLIYFAFGQIGDRYMKVTGKHIRKTVPSGGARHPIETYFFIKNPDLNLTPGIYHYNVEKHALNLVKEYSELEIDNLIRSKLLLDEKRGQFDFSLAIVYTCIFERSMFRYRESRSYRVMQFDLGHLTQNLALLTKTYGLNLYVGYSCLEKEVENIIGVDNYLESCLGYSIL